MSSPPVSIEGVAKREVRQERSLHELRLPRDRELILDLPPVEESVLPTEEAKDAAKSIGSFRGLLIKLTNPDDWVGENKEGQTEYVHGEDVFWRLLDKVASYYACALYRFAETASPKTAAEFVTDHPLPLEEGQKEFGAETHLKLVHALITLIQHDACALQQFTSAIYDESGLQPGELPAEQDPDITAIDSFRGLHEVNERAEPSRRAIGMKMFSLALDYRIRVLGQRNDTRQKEIQESLAGLSPRELMWLARRSNPAVRKYGAKRVERIFEQRLALLFQSLGFTVVQARPGLEAADLLCISRTERFSFLVDAKSTKAKYVLPRSDQRALRDYASDFRQKLPDLPPLAMVLIVSWEAAATVPKKLERLQLEMELPVRFVPIKVLSEFSARSSRPSSSGALSGCDERSRSDRRRFSSESCPRDAGQHHCRL